MIDNLFYNRQREKEKVSMETGYANGNDTEGFTTMDGDTWYSIYDYSDMEPFFMSIISPDDLWMYISSTGGLTAGRINEDCALFPYYTHDRVTENHTNTGSHTILRVHTDQGTVVWEPFARYLPLQPSVERVLRKNATGNRLVFIERRKDLGLEFRYSWSASPSWGWVRTATLVNLQDKSCSVGILDGVRNVLPTFVTKHMQDRLANLVDAYKINEVQENGLALYGLSSRISDKAEATESLRVSTAWHHGLPKAKVMVSEGCATTYPRTGSCEDEVRAEGVRGAYYCNTDITLKPQETRQWILVLEVNQSHVQVATLMQKLTEKPEKLYQDVLDDIKQATGQLRHLAARTDGVHLVKNPIWVEHQYANSLFNSMRGGLFLDGYQVETKDIASFVQEQNISVFQQAGQFFAHLPPKLLWMDFWKVLEAYKDDKQVVGSDVLRIMHGYLPLFFSRRHGDPSRPWNKFSIQLKHEDGSPRYYYEGNWRDIFQNWEPLAFSYPLYLENMITICANGITIDGYNPYRVMRGGFSWERPDPTDPWTNIGYWSDHQVIYLIKLMEAASALNPAMLDSLLTDQRFTFVNVPYRIKELEAILKDPFNTIEFDEALDEKIRQDCQVLGNEGNLLHDDKGNLHIVSFIEKWLIILLTKNANLVPSGGIWMNTQRPEWNDANNALVGNGLSMVTLYYMIRAIRVIRTGVSNRDQTSPAPILLTDQTCIFLERMTEALDRFSAVLHKGFGPKDRMDFLQDVGKIGSDYRLGVYHQGPSMERQSVGLSEILHYLEVLESYLVKTAAENVLENGMYHAYNSMVVHGDKLDIKRLPIMLEGQVAVLSSGILSLEDTIHLLDSLRASEVYREDQKSYLLYPRFPIPGFLDKNTIDRDLIQDSPLIMELLRRGEGSLVVEDCLGELHFNADISCDSDVQNFLDTLCSQPDLRSLVEDEREWVISLFKKVFDHESFTGRSGRMFAFEGSGSVYWHMVSKLLLAVQEQVLRAYDMGAPLPIRTRLIEQYRAIRGGLGFCKNAREFGAFPMDPYSHSPWGKGAKQPGLTGQVKEELLTRMGELGLRFLHGRIQFNPFFLSSQEYLPEGDDFIYYDSMQNRQMLHLEPSCLAFTVCQIPVIYHSGSENEPSVHVSFAKGSVVKVPGCMLSTEDSQHVIQRDGAIGRIDVYPRSADA
ncbi:MAG: hypothetical protein JEY71_16710 [Sphaerochaeta sp.]|nr:hypothetical protein [Sphaerochaeta sp.]